MKNIKQVYLTLFFVSASIICFEIVSTRISSLIFAYNYAYIILSLAILGLGMGGIFSHYKIKSDTEKDISKVIARSIIFIGFSLAVFILSIIIFSISNPFIYFFLLILPFFFAGLTYSQIFKLYAGKSFALYTSDLAGAAVGSAASIFIIGFLGASNSILFLTVTVFSSVIIFTLGYIEKGKLIAFSSIIIIAAVFILINGNTRILGSITIGDFPEKDIYHVYDDPTISFHIIDSRWSIHGRSDLVQYSNQDFVRQMFIDGAAGTQVYRFNGNKSAPGKMLNNLLLSQTTTIPFLFLTEPEKENMLAIGPGGGKEVLIGLLDGVKNITGVEVNPDFVNIVKKYKNYDGGIYTDFPNIDIKIKEGRNYIKQTNKKFDLIVMALPSTEQLQNIDNLAMNENYLLTVEALKDYMKILTPSGSLIFTVHNRLELLRLIITSLTAFNEMGISNEQALNHFVVVERDYAPTIMIRKNALTGEEISRIQNTMKGLPAIFPEVTYYHGYNGLPSSMINRFFETVANNRMAVKEYVESGKYNVGPCYDDSPYFYKLSKGISGNYSWLLGSVAVINFAVFFFPFSRIKKNLKKNKLNELTLPLLIFICIGIGFMILEVSLFQKMILYLGSPTIALAILLGSLLIGMGVGSFLGNRIYSDNIKKRLSVITLLIVIAGTLLFLIYPFILDYFLAYSLTFRALLSFILILPFGFLLGVPFPSSVQLLKQENLEKYIPWMYGINGTMSVLGSISAVVISMALGFTYAFFAGLGLYLIIFLRLATESEK